jgi:hypothetical protein
MNRLWVPIAVWLPENSLLGTFGGKRHRITVTEFIGLCRKQVEGEKSKGRRFQAFQAARSR